MTSCCSFLYPWKMDEMIEIGSRVVVRQEWYDARDGYFDGMIGTLVATSRDGLYPFVVKFDDEVYASSNYDVGDGVLIHSVTKDDSTSQISKKELYSFISARAASETGYDLYRALVNHFELKKKQKRVRVSFVVDVDDNTRTDIDAVDDLLMMAKTEDIKIETEEEN